jgi:hypothetical protein
VGRVIRPDAEIPVARAPSHRLANVERFTQYSSTWLFNSNPQSGTNYVFQLSDVGIVVEALNPSPTIFTIPNSQALTAPFQPFQVGSILRVYCEGAGGLTLVGAPGVTIRGVTTVPQYASAAWRQRALNEWVPDLRTGATGQPGPPGAPGAGMQIQDFFNVLYPIEPILQFNVEGLDISDDPANTRTRVSLDTNWNDSTSSYPGAGSTGSHADSHGSVSTSCTQSHGDSGGQIQDHVSNSNAGSFGVMGSYSAKSSALSGGIVNGGTVSNSAFECHADSQGLVGQSGASGTGHHADSGGTVGDSTGNGNNSHANSSGTIGPEPEFCHVSSAGEIGGTSGHGCGNCEANSGGHVAVNPTTAVLINGVSSAVGERNGYANASFSHASGGASLTAWTGEIAESSDGGVSAGEQGLAQLSRQTQHKTVYPADPVPIWSYLAMRAETMQFLCQIAGYCTISTGGMTPGGFGHLVRGTMYSDGATARLVGTPVVDTWADAQFGACSVSFHFTGSTFAIQVTISTTNTFAYSPTTVCWSFSRNGGFGG